MVTTSDTAKELIRILKKIDVEFSDGIKKFGSGFLSEKSGEVITCAHVVSEIGKSIKSIKVNNADATIKKILPDYDLAILQSSEKDISQFSNSNSLNLGDNLMFSGFPIGVLGPSIFSGTLSAYGDNLIKFPKCKLIQINGMINLGNSGGPVIKADTLEIVGVITAKYVPLLQEIDNLRDILRSIPQFPSSVGIAQIDFSKFVNLVMKALLSISGSLRLVQVGIGYAIPIEFIYK